MLSNINLCHYSEDVTQSKRGGSDLSDADEDGSDKEGEDEEGRALGSRSGSAALTTLLSELILATKEANARTRGQAYQLLIEIPRAMERRAAGVSGGGFGGGGAMLGRDVQPALIGRHYVTECNSAPVQYNGIV